MKSIEELKPLVENRVMELMIDAEQRYNRDEIRYPKILYNLKGRCGGQFRYGGIWSEAPRLSLEKCYAGL